jgi:CspA family cold shock protein
MIQHAYRVLAVMVTPLLVQIERKATPTSRRIDGRWQQRLTAGDRCLYISGQIPAGSLAGHIVDGDFGLKSAGCGVRNFGEKRMATGVIKKFIEDRGFGFITPDGSRTDLFFHRRAMAPGCEPTVGTPVEFVEELDPRSGRTRAANVRPI